MYSNTVAMLDEAYIYDIFTVAGAMAHFRRNATSCFSKEEASGIIDDLTNELQEISGVEDIPWEAFVMMSPRKLSSMLDLSPAHFQELWAQYNGLK